MDCGSRTCPVWSRYVLGLCKCLRNAVYVKEKESVTLSYCSSPDVKVSCLICSCSDSDSELSGALNVRLAPLWAAVVTFYRRR
jgi:hypothetical protein